MAIAHVQDLAVQATGSAGSLQSSAFGTNPTTGNTILVFVVLWKGSAVSVSSVTDTAGNTYAKDKSQAMSLNRGSVEVWRSSNITGGGTFKITVNTGTTGVGIVFAASEFSGLANASPLDGAGSASNGGDNSTTTWSTGAFATTNANDLLIAHYGEDLTGTPTGPSGFTVLASFTSGGTGNEDYLVSYYQIVSSTQTSINPTATGGGNGRYGGIGLAYQQATGGGVTYGLFRVANLATGAGGQFFSNPLN